ncbi:MAG TPA: TolC family protein, partial [Bacilli bacterium]|nr:TolC family protein [Bacilli bacterium]
MKKILSVALSASLLIGSMAVNANIVQGANNATQVQCAETSSLLRLTMECAVERAVDTDRNLLMLKIQKEILELQKNAAEQGKNNLDQNKAAIENGLKSKLGYQDADPTDPLNKIIDELIKMQLEQLPTNDQLDKSIQQINTELDKLNLQIEETEEIIRYMMKARFIELVSLEEGLNLQRSHLNSFKGDIQKAKLELELGIIAADSVRQVNRDFSKQERSLKEKENEYNLALNKLRLDLGYSKDQRIKLVPSFSKYPNKITHPSSSKTKQLIENTYQIKKINEDIKQKENLQDSSESNSKELEMLKVQREQTVIRFCIQR